MNLIDVHRKFKSEEDCLLYWESVRWPNGIRCVTCGGDRISIVNRTATSKNKRTRVFTCLEPTCRQQFSATSGTIFHDSHLPLVKWFTALALIVDAKKGISAKQLQRHLQVSYQTAWHLAHRIRKAMEDPTQRLLLVQSRLMKRMLAAKRYGRRIVASIALRIALSAW